MPPIVNEIRALPAELRALLHVPAPGDGPVRPGPGGADRPPRRRVRVLGRRARPAPALAGRDAPTTSSSAPSPASCRLEEMVSEPKPLAPGREGAWSRSTARRARSRLLRARRDAAAGRRALAGAHGRRAPAPATTARSRPAARSRAPEIPGYTAAGPAEPVKVEDRVLAGFGWQRDDVKLVPADGLQRRRADRLARLRRAAGGALARAPEPRRLLQGDGRRRHQPGDRPRARDRALLDPRGVRPPARRIDAAGDDTAHGRDRVPGDPRRPPRPGAALRRDLPRGSPASTRPTCSRTSGRSSAAARRRSTSRCSSPRRPRARSSGSSRRPSKKVRDGAELLVLTDRTVYDGERRYLDPHLATLGGRPGAEAVPGRAGRGEPAPPLRRSSCARRRSATSTTWCWRSASAPTASART